MVESVQVIKSDIPGEMTCAEYGRQQAGLKAKPHRIKDFARRIANVIK